uniref:Secreted protein n=1 Tax=Bursaphelenchus xylophilus TaxID=6326 RepID=A0A1I7S9K7_BURXY
MAASPTRTADTADTVMLLASCRTLDAPSPSITIDSLPVSTCRPRNVAILSNVYVCFPLGRSPSFTISCYPLCIS